MTGWVTATVSVAVRCPQPLPVGFMVRYAQSGPVFGDRAGRIP